MYAYLSYEVKFYSILVLRSTLDTTLHSHSKNFSIITNWDPLRCFSSLSPLSVIPYSL